MSPEQALAAIEGLAAADEANMRPETKGVRASDLRAILAEVQPRYWLPAEVDRLVDAYKRGDLGAVHATIDAIIARDLGARS